MSDEIEKLKAERDFWHNAWQEQRAATGRAWWNGYKTGFEDVELGFRYAYEHDDFVFFDGSCEACGELEATLCSNCHHEECERYEGAYKTVWEAFSELKWRLEELSK